MMSAEDKKTLAELSRRVRERFPEARVWAFGSRARGDASWDSDFDTCIVLKSVDEDALRWIRNIAWEIGFDNEHVISTIVMDSEEFGSGPMSESTLVENILQEGVAA